MTTLRSAASTRRWMPEVALIVLGLLLPLPVASQTPSNTVVIFGRLLDAESREPVARAIIVSGDSATSAVTDSLGNFWIPLGAEPPYLILAGQFGYVPTAFKLPESAPSQRSILILDPAPILIEGITATVLAENEITQYMQRLARRSGGYSGSLRVFDRDRIRREGSGSALDLILTRAGGIHECAPPRDTATLCRRTRGRESTVMVCVDEIFSPSPVHELGNIPMEEIALAEVYGATVAWGPTSVPPIFGGGGAPVFQGGGAGRSPAVGGNRGRVGGSAPQVRVYTRMGILSKAARGARAVWPLIWGCF